MLPFLLFLFPIAAVAIKARECSRPAVPPRLVLSFPGLTKEQQEGSTFQRGTVAVFRCHEDFPFSGYIGSDRGWNSFNSTCRNGAWWPKVETPYNGNYCLNEIKNIEMLNEFTGEKHPLPLKECINIRGTALLTVKFPEQVSTIPIAEITPTPNSTICLGKVLKYRSIGSNFCFVPNYNPIYDSIQSNLDEYSFIVRNNSLCSLKFLRFSGDDSYCNPALLGTPPGAKIAKIVGKRVFYECLGDEQQINSSPARCGNTYYDYCTETREEYLVDDTCPVNSITKSDTNTLWESLTEARCNETEKVKGDENNCICLTGFYRHPDGRCVKFSECPAKMRQGPCADFENFLFSPNSYSNQRQCICKNGLYRVVSTGKCVRAEDYPKNDKYEYSIRNYKYFDLNCKGEEIHYTVDQAYCKGDLVRTRKGDCVKKEDCPKAELL